jgi:hypothetical protein
MQLPVENVGHATGSLQCVFTIWNLENPLMVAVPE